MRYTIVNRQDSISLNLEQKIKKGLSSWKEDMEHPELVICVGGDGTILHALHQYIYCLDKVSFIGIHTGTLGFFTDYVENEIDEFIHDLLHKKPEIFYSPLLEFKLDNEEQLYYALNEIRIENILKSHIMDIYIDDEYFETSKGSGICISTQAGSTAYNRGLRGSIIDNGLSLMQLAEITPIRNQHQKSLENPYILRKDRMIAMHSSTFDTATLCYDHLSMPLNHTKQIICTTSMKKMQFARYKKYSYLERLRTLY